MSQKQCMKAAAATFLVMLKPSKFPGSAPQVLVILVQYDQFQIKLMLTIYINTG